MVYAEKRSQLELVRRAIELENAIPPRTSTIEQRHAEAPPMR